MIDAHKINALIVEHVMDGEAEGDFCTDIADAWEVVEKLQEQFCICVYPKKEQYTVSCFERGDIPNQAITQEATLPMAICLAALKAKGIEYE